MGEEEDEPQPIVGKLYRGSVVVNIDEEHSTRPNGLLRIRKSIQLKNGMNLLEDQFKDPRKIEGDYKEIEYKEVPSPRGIKAPVEPRKKKKKPKAPPLLDEDSDEEKAKREAAAKAKREAEQAARKEREALELKEARELAIQKEAELRAKKEAEERARREEEERLRREVENARKEEQRRQHEEEERKRDLKKQRQRQLEDERLRASQEAARKRKEEADRKREANRKAKEAERKRMGIRDKWEPQSMCVYSPESNVRRKDKASPDTAAQAIWSYVPGTEPDEDFDWWKPQNVIVHPPGKPHPGNGAIDDANTPHGLWAYAPGTAPDEDDEDWNPQGGTTAPKILIFPPGVKPSADNKELKVQGEWTYPQGETSFPPLPTPKNDWEPRVVKVHPKSKSPPSENGGDGSEVHGVWMVYGGDGVEPMGEDDWRVSEIQVFPEGKEPKNLNDSKVRGVWGLAPGAQPNEDGEWNPEQLWFFGPDDAPPDDEDWNPQGTWIHSPEAEREDWPPIAEPQDQWGAQGIWVYPPSQIPEDDDEDWQATGVWNFGDKGEEEAEDWKPYRVTVHPKGQEPASLEDYKVHGVWGLSPGAEPDDDGNWKASDVWFLGPGDELPEDFRPQGVWTVSQENPDEDEDWPPKRETALEPETAVVHPPSNVPSATEDGQGFPQGVWAFGDSSDDEEPDWMPQHVLLHKAGTEPENLDASTPHGAYGYAPDAKPDSDGNYSPSDMWFFMPGEDPPSDSEWSPMGTWTVPPGELKVSFPSETSKAVSSASEPETAVVHPSSKVSSATDDGQGFPQGVWAFGNSSDDEEPDWMPQHVLLHKAGTEPENVDASTPHGAYGYAPDAKPDSDGNYSPSDMWFFMPGEDPPEEWNAMGTWTVPPGKLKVQFPPAKPANTMSKPTPRKVWVYPKKKAPKDIEKGVSKGVWSYSPGKKVMDAGKKPAQVNLYEKGQEPGDLLKKHGVWGYSPGAQPNSDGDYLAEDMWLFAPGETPPDEWQPQGVWSEPPPPPKKSVPKTPKPEGGTKETTKEKRPRRRKFEKSAWVYPTKAKAPSKGEKKNPEGCWTKLPGGSEDDEPQEILLYAKGNEPSDIAKLPHGMWGYAPGSQPDDDGVWSPKDMLFYPPGETPPPDLQNQGIWSYPHGSRIEITTNYRYEGDDIIYMKLTEIFYMDTVISFSQEHRGK
jgi:hypothetical protein